MKTNNTEKLHTEKIDYGQVYRFIRDNSRGFYIAKLLFYGLPVLWGINASLSPYFAKQIVDTIVKNGFSDMGAILRPFVAYLSWIGGIFILFSLDDYYIFMEAIPKIRKNMSMSLLKRLLTMDHEFFQANFSGTLAAKIADASDEISVLFKAISWGFIKTVAMIPIAIFTMWQVNSQIAIAMSFWASSFLFFTYFYGSKISQMAQAWSEVKSRNAGKIVDIVSNITTVRFFGGQAREESGGSEFLQDATNAERKMEFNFFIIWSIYKFTYYLFLVFAMLKMLSLWRLGACTAGDFLLVFQINATVGSHFWQIVLDFSQFLRSCGKISQAIKTILDYEPKIVDCPGAVPLKVTRGKIEFNEVSFNYPGCSEPIFTNKTIVIEPGQKVGLVGPSGSGKTTFVNLILRNFDADKGCVMIDGQDIKKVTLESLRASISIVTQESILFNRTVYQNIAYSKKVISPDQVYEAAKFARAHEFIAGLEHGYENSVGERGSNLSGGQRQRVSIARAILKNAPILIFDEATSQLDSIVEREIQTGFELLMKDKTVLAIAHRLATIEKMDRILVFHKGKIVDDGTHKELSSKPGLYKSLLEAQKLDYFD